MMPKTSRLKFLTSVMVAPHRPAVLTAKMLATIDVMSGGRAGFLHRLGGEQNVGKLDEAPPPPPPVVAPVGKGKAPIGKGKGKGPPPPVVTKG